MKACFIAVFSLISASFALNAQESVTLSSGTVVTIRNAVTLQGQVASIAHENGGYLWITLRDKCQVVRAHAGTGLSTTVLEVPVLSDPVDPNKKGGVFGITLSTDFDRSNGYVFVSRTTPSDKLIVTRYSFDGAALVEPKVIFTAEDVPHTLGLTIKALSDRTLLISVASFDTHQPAKMDNLNGKFVRVTYDGNAVSTNPYYNAIDPSSVQSFVYTYGHRNPLGVVQLPNNHPSLPGALFSTECGPWANDEINRLESGRNYGWLTSAGYCTQNVRNTVCPLVTFNQAPSGIDFYHSNAIPEWTNSLVFGSLRRNGLVFAQLLSDGSIGNKNPDAPAEDVMVLESDQLIPIRVGGIRQRATDVAVTSDGRIYISCENQANGGKSYIVAFENPAIHGPLSTQEFPTSIEHGLTCGPVPAPEVLTVRLAQCFESQWTLRVIDINGRVVHSQSNSNNVNQIAIATGSFSEGAYMILAGDGARTYSATFIR